MLGCCGLIVGFDLFSCDEGTAEVDDDLERPISLSNFEVFSG